MTMKCEGFRVFITGYIDGELSDREMHTLKAHLRECSDCLQHLQRQEKMQAMLKRYSFVQELPEIPNNFASTIATRLQEEQEVPAVSLISTWTERYRRFALQLIEKFTRSLRIRPLAWTASMSSALVLLVGVLSFELYHYSSQYTAPQFNAQTGYDVDAPLLVASVDEDEMPIFGDMEQESLIVFEDSEVPVEELRITGVASHTPDPVDDYVYSHVMEGYQERLIEDVVLVGYVQ